jgi:hypothetical protein
VDCAGQPDHTHQHKGNSEADQPRHQRPPAASTRKFFQLDLVSGEQEQHSESELAKYFKTLTDRR